MSTSEELEPSNHPQPIQVPVGSCHIRFIANSKVLKNLMYYGIEKGQNGSIVGNILPSLQSHNALKSVIFCCS